MLKLVYYIGNAVVHEEEVPLDNISSAICEVTCQDYSDYMDGDEEEEYFDGLICLQLDDKGSLVWQNSDGERGFDFDAMQPDIDKRIQDAMKELCEYGGSY